MTFLLLAQIVHDFQVHCECTVNIIIIINLELQFVKIKDLSLVFPCEPTDSCPNKRLPKWTLNQAAVGPIEI